MKRTIAALLALMMLLCLTACGEKDEDENADSDKKPSTASTTKKEAPSAPEWVLVQELGPQGEVLAEYEYDQNGNQTAKRSYYDEGKVNWAESPSMQYDENGVLIKKYYAGETDVGPDECDTYCVYDYDDNGNCIKETNYEYGSLFDFYERKYDENGRLIEETYSEDNTPREKVVYKYDKNGNCISSRGYNCLDDDNLNWLSWNTWDKEYDEKGQEIKCTYYEGEKQIRFWNEYLYDEKGNQTGMRSHTEDRMSWADSWDKEYDENGNCVKQIGFKQDGAMYVMTEYRYARFENGAVVTTAPVVTTTTEAPTTTAAKKIGYATDALNVRRDASTDHDRVGMLKKGDAVTIIGEDGDFYKIEYKWTQEGSSGDYAFVSKEYVSDKKPG